MLLNSRPNIRIPSKIDTFESQSLAGKNRQQNIKHRYYNSNLIKLKSNSLPL